MIDKPDWLAKMAGTPELLQMLAAGRSYAAQDRLLASTFARAAERAGLERIIYLGGLGRASEDGLSPHLESRQEVGRILRALD